MKTMTRVTAELLTAIAVLAATCGTELALGAESDPEPSQLLAEELVRRIGVQRGICTVLGEDGDLPIRMAQASELLVHVRQSGQAQVDRLRREADEAGLGIDRLVVQRGNLQRLPYPDNMVDAVVVTRATESLLRSLPASELLRVLRPEGLAIVGKAMQSDGPDVDAQKLRQWAGASGAATAKVDRFGTWVELAKPVLPGADDWSHWEKSPDNNPVSDDAIIKAPYLTQFMAKPWYIGMPSITTAAGGRTFLAIGHIAHHRREWELLNKIIARNGYNGTILWERSLPEGYLVHRSCFIASKDIFYMIDGDRCLMLDAATGQERGEIRIPDLHGEWKWMAIKDNVLFALAGEPDDGVTTTKGDRAFGGWSWADLSKEYYPQRIPVGFGDTLAAFDLESSERKWIQREESLIDSRGMALRDGKVFLYCPDRHLRCLDENTGNVVWTTSDRKVLNLIEQPGKGLTSTPGWRTQTLVMATPDALIIQGQTRMNVVAVSTEDGYLLWTKRKITNNPNAIYVDGNVILGVGEEGSHLVIDPVSGEVKADLDFQKRACTRLTACSDSFFVRGEGLLRFDRETEQVAVDGSARPACNDGAMPANGLLYLGPWQCDCNLSLIGNIARCSAGDFRFDLTATEQERLERAADFDNVEQLTTSEKDWPTYRANNDRSSASKSNLPADLEPQWQYRSRRPYVPTVPVAAGGLVFTAGNDGKVRAIDSAGGELRWEYATPAPISYPPTIWSGRAYVGCADGHVYCLEAATGRLLWRFQAAPVERQIMVYGNLSSTWPVGSGVLVDDGIAYFAAGIIDHDGTYVYALDAKTGSIIWQNNESGHLSESLRKGVSVQGNLSIFRNQLVLAGGNQVSPAQFNLKTGECLSQPYNRPAAIGQPIANGGRFVGVMHDRAAIVGGRILYSSPRNVSTKGSFVSFGRGRAWTLVFGGVAPAWDEDAVAMVNFKHGELTCCDAEKIASRSEAGGPATGADRRATLAALLERDKAIRWQTDLNTDSKFEAVSLAVCPDGVVAVVQYQHPFRAHPQWAVVTLDKKNGRERKRHELADEPLPEGLLVDADGKVVVTMLSGQVLCLGAAG